MTFLGRPEVLAFRNVYEFEQAQTCAKKVTLENASYRMTDGAFLYVNVSGVDGVTYFYASTKPAPTDLPVAFELRLTVGQ
jgi:hypothetical protein